jgi:hypothetical protein
MLAQDACVPARLKELDLVLRQEIERSISERSFFVYQGNSIYFFVVRQSYCETTIKHRFACFTTLSGGRCPHHSPPAREITSPLTPERAASPLFYFIVGLLL